MKNEACVLGFGVVGGATAKALKIKFHYDIDPSKSNINFNNLKKYRLIFVCLPTPIQKNKKYKLNHISSIIKKIEKLGGEPIYIIRSTVFPGFAKKLQEQLRTERIVSNPEFLSEKTAYKDTKYPPFLLVGGSSGKYTKIVVDFLRRYVKAPLILTDNTSAELGKLAMNSYFAIKVIFANQLYDIAANIDADYDSVKKILESHPFGPNNHFKVWFNDKRGVRGNCLPKDSAVFSNFAGSDLVRKAVSLNKKYINIKPQSEKEL